MYLANRFKIAISLLVIQGAAYAGLDNNQDSASSQQNTPTHVPQVCSSLEQFSFDADYIYWKIQNPNVPVILAASGSSFSALVNSNTRTTVLGNESFNIGWRSGARVAAQYRFCTDKVYGIQANYFILPKSSTSASRSLDGSLSGVYVGMPFVDVSNTINPPVIEYAFPGQFGGTLNLSINNTMQGGEINGVFDLICSESGYFDFLLGVRYLYFQESLLFSTNLPNVPPLPGDVWTTSDQFNARNNFYGANLGFQGSWIWNSFFIKGTAKLALGGIQQKAVMQGLFRTNDFTNFITVQHFNQGNLILSSNTGKFAKTRFSVIPEVNLDLGWEVTDNFSIKVGYNVLYIAKVLRSGQQISDEINGSASYVIQNTGLPLNVIGPADPQPNMNTKGMWVQGLNAGINLSF